MTKYQFDENDNSNGIYKFENQINHKIYIGQAENLRKRYKKHFSNIKDNSHQEDFYKALREYGWDNFSYEILEKFSPAEYNEEKLDNLECFYIKKYNSLKPNGYNMTEGGHHHASINKIISVRQYDLQGNFIKEYESIAQARRETLVDDTSIVACCKQRGRKTAGNYQWRYTSDNISKLEDISNEVRKININIYQYDLQGNFIKKYSCLDYILIEHSSWEKSNICAVLKGTNKIAYNYQWCYENENNKITNLDMTVLQLDKKSNQIINEFITASEAARKTNISRSNIGETLNKKRKSAGGFKWIYKKEYINKI